MGSSFQEQLLKLGLVDKKKVEKSKKEQYQKRKKKERTRQQPPVDENKILAEQALEKKKQRARQLNMEREEKLRKRESAARIRQMIETGRLPKDKNGVAYRFVDREKIYRIFISQELVDRLVRGSAGIVRLADGYEVCPADVIAKIRAVDESVVVFMSDKGREKNQNDEDDPYAGFEVPDDLMW